MNPSDQLPQQLATELARQYDVIRLVGRGGMGAVWLARERSLDRLVAIKVLSGEAVEATSVRERFRREARVAARLVHPHIVPLHAFGETPDALYFVMGYVEGETLADRLDRDGRVSKGEAIRILSEMADALAFAHREGVVHRDVKPENILLDRKSGRALLADFGVARMDSAGTQVTMPGMAVGTPTYMSPEQALGLRDVDGRSDLYSLGVVGYRMLAGRLPFTGASGQAVMAQHAAQRPGDLALLVGSAEQSAARVIMRALEKEPGDRWARGEDMRAELENAARSNVMLPERLQTIQALGTKLLGATTLIAGIYGSALLWNPRWFAPEAGTTLPIVLTLSLFPAIAAAIAATRARMFGWRETLRVMLNPGASWKHWWPRALRRKDDIWDQLPKPLRRLRNVIDGVVLWFIADTAFLVTMATTVVGDRIFRFMHSGPDWVPPLLFAVPKLAAVGWIVLEYLRAKRKLGVDSHELAEMLSSGHLASDAVWSKPRFARLLDGAAPGDGSAARPAIPRSPDELLRAIVELSARVDGTGLLPHGESATAARNVCTAIDALDDEIRRLSSEIDPAELARVERRLASVGDDADLRRLLENQRELWQRLQSRLQTQQARRERMHDQLATLWMQLLELDARITRGAPADLALTGELRALCGEIARAGAALSDVEKLMLPAERVVTPT